MLLNLSLLACIVDPPDYPVAEPAPAPAAEPGPPSEEPAALPVEAKVALPSDTKVPGQKPKNGCEPGEFTDVPASVRPLVGLWKNEEDGQLIVRSDRKGRLSLSYEARGELNTWTAALALSKAGKKADLEFLLTDSAVPDKRWRYEVNADNGRRLVGSVVETTLYTDGDGPEDSLPQPVSLVRLCGPP